MFKKHLLCGALTFYTLASLAAQTYPKHITTLSSLSDTAITAKINALYTKSPTLNDSSISVTTFNHNVVLSGRVATDTQYERAISLADSVIGVNDVNADNLTVKVSKAPLTDTYLTAKVKGMLLKEKLFGRKSIDYWPIKIETKNSVVYLSGKVRSITQKNNLDNLVHGVSGIKSVNSSITTTAVR
jgi:hyperosmotically inducible protein